MAYISPSEASDKWHVPLNEVRQLLTDGRIPYATKWGKSWMIPDDAVKPAWLCRDIETKKANKLTPADLTYVVAATRYAPRGNPDSIFGHVKEERIRLIYEGAIAYLRGEFERAINCYRQIDGEDAAKLRACPLAIAAAVYMGDYSFYTEVENYLKGIVEANMGPEISATAELSLAGAYLSTMATNMVPDWLKAGNFVLLPAPLKPGALHKLVKYYQCVGDYKSMLAVGQTVLTLCVSEGSISYEDIYLRLLCAVACYQMEQVEEAKRYLLSAMDISLPHGFITPFAEHIPLFGGLMENCLNKAYPQCSDPIINQWKRTFKNWLVFHNHFTNDNITLILSLREYELALLVARRVPYAKIAEQYCISVGRLKNIVQEIYGKLYISGREELSKYVL